MKILPCLLLLLSLSIVSAAPDPAALVKLRNEWQEDLLASKRKLDKVYFEELEEMKNNFLKGGDLKAAVAAQNAFDQRDNDEKEPAEIIKLRTTYKTSTNAERKKITKRYYEELSKLKKAYMEATDLENSIAVDSEMKKVADQYNKPELWRPRRNTTSKGTKSKGADNFKGFQIEFVTVGNPGNPKDDTGYGTVTYAYRIGKYEVSEAMINAYNQHSGGPKISKNSRSLNKPATGVSWNEAARFVNWLNTSQGYPPAYKFLTSGANDNVSLWSSAEAWQLGGENLFRNRRAKYFLPVYDEWYKAAYYDPKANFGKGGYWDYATGSDMPPRSITQGNELGTIVWRLDEGTGPAEITRAGGLSPHFTMAQNGNAWEWIENLPWGGDDQVRNNRATGGPAWYTKIGEYSFTRSMTKHPPSKRGWALGFRVASVAD